MKEKPTAILVALEWNEDMRIIKGGISGPLADSMTEDSMSVPTHIATWKNSIYIAGIYYGTISFDGRTNYTSSGTTHELFIVELDAHTGKTLWCATIPQGSRFYNYPVGLVVDKGGN